jgi:two-component system, OmpR family, sensor histidine kinase BaeS
MARSLTLKLALAFLVVGVIGAALAAGLARWITLNEFGNLVLDEGRSDFIEAVSAYYQANGSWDGVARSLPPIGAAPAPQPLPQPPPQNTDRPGAQPLPTFAFALVDMDGYVVVPAGPYQMGDAVSPDELEQGTAVTVDGQVVGTVLISGKAPELNSREELFLTRINWALLYAALGAVLVALVLGLFLARTLTRPLRELTAASQAMAQGNLEQQVAVRSRDELGELAAAFNQMSAELARANRSRRQMTADIAHDLRTPLTVIKGYAEALRNGDLPPAAATFETVYQEAEHLSHLVEDLRTLSLVDAGKLTLHRQAVQPGDILERTAAAHLPQAQQSGITLGVDVAADLSPIHADPERLVQVLGNLVGNALRYTPEGGRITLAARQQAGGIRLTVRDTGAGIDPADLPHIFDRFYRGDDSRETNEGESGLGLAIAKSLVEAHGGSISVTSTPGEGSTFAIILPCVPGE